MTCPDFPLNPINTIILAPFLLLTSRLAPPLQVPPHLRFGDQGLGKQRQRHVRGLWGEKTQRKTKIFWYICGIFRLDSLDLWWFIGIDDIWWGFSNT